MLTRMKRFFKWLLLTVVILAGGIAVVLYNPNLAKGPFERRLGKATGYGLSLEGDLDLSVGRSIELSVADLHVAAPDWSANDDLAVIRHLRLRLNSASLFSGIPIVEELHIRSVNLNLEVDADGNGNWIPPRTTASMQTWICPGAPEHSKTTSYPFPAVVMNTF